MTYATLANRFLFRSIVGAFNQTGPLETELRKRRIPCPVFNGDASALTRFLRSESVDVVHLHSGFPNDILAIRAIANAGIRLVLRTNAFGWFDRVDATGIVNSNLFVSKFALHRFVYHSGKSVDEVLARDIVSYVPIDTATYRPDPEKRIRFRRELGVGPATVLIGRLGRPDQSKLDVYLLRSLANYRENGPDWRVVFLGGITRELERFGQRSGMEDHVTALPGPLSESEVVSALVGLDTYAHTSRVGESFGQAIAEAMACAIPVVAQWTPYADDGTPELVDNGASGYLCISESKFQNALSRLMRDPALREQVGMNARSTVMARFDSQRLIRFYERLVLSRLGVDRTDEKESMSYMISLAQELDQYWKSYAIWTGQAWHELSFRDRLRIRLSRGYLYSKARGGFYRGRSMIYRSLLPHHRRSTLFSSTSGF